MINETYREPMSKTRGGTRQRVRAAVREREHRAFPAPAIPLAMLYLRPERYAEPVLEFCSFDAAYIESLCAGDRPTQDHFVGYFTTLLQLKLRSRLQSPQAIEDVRQETFARVIKALRSPGTLRQPERLGAFVNTVCNNVLFEHYRVNSRSQSLDEEGQPELPAIGATPLEIVVGKQMKEKVREILTDMNPRDRMVLKAVFIDERDRDEICREFGVEKDYLRVLLHRAKQEFKAEYLKRFDDDGPKGGPKEPKKTNS
jgi:RNA polymerase sigma-70 factor, ECF subfamily